MIYLPHHVNIILIKNVFKFALLFTTRIIFQSLSSLDKTRLETFIFLFEDIISSSSEEDTEVDFFNFFPEFIGLGVGDDLGRLGVLFKDTIT